MSRIAGVLAVVLVASTAHAQGIDRRYTDEPTAGVAIPTTPLAGEHDARATTYNPGGLALLRGPDAVLALDLEDPDTAPTVGQGFGTYLGTATTGAVLPRMGFGMAFEWLRPPRAELTPDPGEPFRFTLGYALGLGRNAGFGVAWHHFLADGAVAGTNTFDLGLSTRWGNHLAVGAVVRDLATSPIAGVPVQRTYELEAVVRPLGTQSLELALGGRLGETRLDTGGWARASVRAARGVYVLAQLETRELHAIEDSPAGPRDLDVRDLRATLGIELSFGNASVTALGTGLRDDTGGNHLLGGTFLVHATTAGTPSIIPPDDHIERVELTGSIEVRELTALVMRLRSIARDPTAKALVVTFDDVTAGWATLQELRAEIVAVKQRKKVFAYMVSGTGRDYFVASAADKIYIDPAGGLRVTGMAGTSLYFRGAFDQIGVLPQFEKIGEYKSAPEMFTQTGPTPIAAKMHDEMFDSIWNQWLAAVAEGRKLSIDEVNAIIDAGPYTAGQLARDSKLVDAVAAPDKISVMITTELGAVYGVSVPPVDRPDRWERPGIAVIYSDGDITGGQSKKVPIVGESLVGGESITGAIVAARNDPRVGAIILRIDSPGGSALASELIAREVFATRGVKPILCSMSNLAASGGYFVAAGCDVIYAEPMTITGSIGIFTGKFDLAGLVAKLGITVDTFKRGKHADEESMFRPYTDEERASVMEQMRYMYARFVGAVAEGRGLTRDAVDQVGRGHVYTGEAALPLKLVDRFGGLGDAVEDAKQRMHLASGTKVQLYELPKVPSNLFGVVGNLLGVHEQATVQLGDLPVLRALIRGLPLSLLVAPDAAQARLPYDIQFSE